jgi:hypothetical protein
MRVRPGKDPKETVFFLFNDAFMYVEESWLGLRERCSHCFIELNSLD